MSIADLRREYTKGGLDEAHVEADPLLQFRRWFDEAVTAGVEEPNAMTLATADATGKPSARTVLLKGVDRSGFVFFTNYGSQKGRDLAENPRACLVFFWKALERQVSVQGRVEKVSRAETEAYFRTRPTGSQLGAWASEQSQVIGSRAELEAKLEEVTARFTGQEIQPPPGWGGYRVIPESLEFWQGRPSRLHDRLRYRKEGEQFVIERLCP
jgi:pyridoxamine 5'-phosphate oxidase